MSYNESNNEFFSYEGTINRKNYIINMLILISLFFGISFVRFEAFEQYITFKFLYDVLIFLISFFKFVIIFSAISTIYRRIADFSRGKSYSFFEKMKKLFVIFFIFPLLYIFCLKFLISSIPIIDTIIFYTVFFVLIPVSIIFAIVFCFLKSGK